MKRKYHIPEQFGIDGELVDNLARYALKWHYNSIVEDMDNFVLHQQGHPDDYERNVKLKQALKTILEYWGDSL
jgi:hypothetical protein